jgi:hypothetical protein
MNKNKKKIYNYFFYIFKKLDPPAMKGVSRLVLAEQPEK